MIEIKIPEMGEPVFKDIETCECAKHPVKFTYEKGSLKWLVTAGEDVEEGQVVCEGYYEKKNFEFAAPGAGELMILKGEGEPFKAGDVIAYILDDED